MHSGHLAMIRQPATARKKLLKLAVVWYTISIHGMEENWLPCRGKELVVRRMAHEGKSTLVKLVVPFFQALHHQ